ncbi:polysaccharide pyruvyl transferase family protein [Phocaeicola coprocola]|uniref:polysaccharide pyruvyl transferase family protein n=1 Tax=Phocaeicola coprocola TaxID=310298 RepID=UPI004028A6D3
MKTITIITLQNIRNYGSALQALATQKIFEQLGLQVDFINYLRENACSNKNKIKTWCQGMPLLKKLFYSCALYPSFLLMDKKFNRFLQDHLHEQKQTYSTEEDFKKFPITSDIYCTGSDQTWNSGWNGGVLPSLFLSFVPDNIPKIAYSASFGKSKLDEWEKEETKKLLQRYQAISVRESSGVDIINNLGISGAVHVLDPTLQLNKDFWKQYAGKRNIRVPYLLIYQLNTNSQFDKYAKEMAKRKGLKLVRFCTRIDQCIKCGKSLIIPEVLDFVSLIYHADLVITDSFHATAFSINVNTPFISIYPDSFGGRLESILKLTKLENRHLKSYTDFSYVTTSKMDFTYANEVLEKEREKGYKFLKQALKIKL